MVVYNRLAEIILQSPSLPEELPTVIRTLRKNMDKLSLRIQNFDTKCESISGSEDIPRQLLSNALDVAKAISYSPQSENSTVKNYLSKHYPDDTIIVNGELPVFIRLTETYSHVYLPIGNDWKLSDCNRVTIKEVSPAYFLKVVKETRVVPAIVFYRKSEEYAVACKFVDKAYTVYVAKSE